jgi:hypothetical protein
MPAPSGRILLASVSWTMSVRNNSSGSIGLSGGIHLASAASMSGA